MQLKQFMVLALAAVMGCAVWAQTAPEPVNPHATPEARALLAYLDSISGKATIAGQHNYPHDGARWTDLAYDLTGKYPGLYGEDFGFAAGDEKDSVTARPAVIEEVKRQYRNGAVIALTWHEVRPTDDEPVTFTDSVQGHLTDYEWQQLLTPGTPLYNRWCAQVDVIAGYLRQLRDAHVPVLFRPYHEMNGKWFWWGGRPGINGSAALYRQLYDRFVNVHHLDNLVWVWNVNAPEYSAGPIADYYPGAQYADVVTIDIYGEFKQKYYDGMVALAGDKPIALAEVGRLPSPEVLDRQPRWTYFMVWSERIEADNTPEQANAIYHAPRALARDDPRMAGPMAAIRKISAEQALSEAGRINAHLPFVPETSAVPVTPDANRESRSLLETLAAAAGHTVLSGQENGPASPLAASEEVFQATGHWPFIYAIDLGSPLAGTSLAEARKAIVDQAIRVNGKKARVISLSWRPARPTDDAPASTHGKLTDYEWNDLLTPGSALNKRWGEQVDELAASLHDLEKAGIAVLWNPLPEANSKDFWWAGRKGVRGSAELYRQLFERLVNHDGLKNLVWVWEADPPGSKPDEAGMPSDYFPGLLYADAIELRLNWLDSRFPAAMVAQGAVGKPVGVELTGSLPEGDVFADHAVWSWFLATPPASPPSDPSARREALRKLYAAGKVAQLIPTQ